MDAVARSLQEFGLRQPIVVDKDGVVVVGHTRWKAALKRGLKPRGRHPFQRSTVRSATATESSRFLCDTDGVMGEVVIQ